MSHGDDPPAQARGDAAEAARVGAHVPDHVAPGGAQELVDEGVLATGGVVAVARVLGVVRPLGAGRLPVQAC